MTEPESNEVLEVTPAMRGECLVPPVDQRWLMRQMSLIDFSIERKVYLLLAEQRAEEKRLRRARHNRERAAAHKNAPPKNGGQLTDNEGLK